MANVRNAMSYRAWLRTFQISGLFLTGSLIVVVLLGSVEVRKYCWVLAAICAAICLKAAWKLKDGAKRVSFELL